jgi:hypothetical protein
VIQRSVRRNLLAIRSLARPKRRWRPKQVLREARVALVCVLVVPGAILIEAVLSEKIEHSAAAQLTGLLIGTIAATALLIVLMQFIQIQCLAIARLFGLLLFRHYVARVGTSSAENTIRQLFHRLMAPILAIWFAIVGYFFYDTIFEGGDGTFAATIDMLTVALVSITIAVNIVLIFAVSVRENRHGAGHVSARYYGSNLRALEIFVDTMGFSLVLLCIGWILVPIAIWVVFTLADAFGIAIPGGASVLWRFVDINPSPRDGAIAGLLGWDPRALTVLSAVLELFFVVLLTHCCAALVCHGWLQGRLRKSREGYSRLIGNVAKTALFIALFEIFLRYGFLIEDNVSISLLAVLIVTSFIFAIDQDRVEGERRYLSKE